MNALLLLPKKKDGQGKAANASTRHNLVGFEVPSDAFARSVVSAVGPTLKSPVSGRCACGEDGLLDACLLVGEMLHQCQEGEAGGEVRLFIFRPVYLELTKRRRVFAISSRSCALCVVLSRVLPELSCEIRVFDPPCHPKHAW